MPADVVRSVCPHDCPSVCALEVERLNRQTIGKIRGSHVIPYTGGVVCAKLSRYAERQHHPERLSTPLRRVGDKGVGRTAYEPMSWDDALDEIVERFTQAAQRHGRETVWPFFYAGTMGLVQRNSIQRLRHAMGWSRQHSTYCIALADPGWMAGTGAKRGTEAMEMAESDLVVIWGSNPIATNLHVWTLANRARKERGAKIVVIDPYRSPTAEGADLHLAPRPGTDAALACAVMHVLFKEGYADRDYLARHTSGAAELETHVASRDPAWASAVTGLCQEEIVAFARLYGQTKRSYLKVGYGFSRQRNGAMQVFAVSCLPAVTGAWAERGGGALYSNSGLLHLEKSLIEATDRIDTTTRILDMSRIGPVLTGDRRDLGGGPPVTAMLMQNTNPMVVAPETLKVRQGMMRDDLFLVVHEQFMTETAAMADIVLPATTFLEHDDIYAGSGHTFLQVARAMLEPYADCRSNNEVINALARRFGADDAPGFHLTAWELIDQTLAASDLPGADTIHAAGGLDLAKTFEKQHFLDGFGHPDGRFHFQADWAELGPNHAELPALPDHVAIIEAADAEHPFRLVAPPARNFLNSSFGETPSSRRLEGRPTARMHPTDLARLGLVDGDRVRLGNRRGSVVVHAKPAEGQQTGVVVVEGLWPNAAFEEGVGINTLTSADPGRPNGGGVFHDAAVWIKTA
ncbi:MAG TPA: molybdopterin oxidoreductase family protein [Azospirillaceae bacterium]|nr:molybdopterin oxidoreductase family protein [Azospirillaceae bacterium]